MQKQNPKLVKEKLIKIRAVVDEIGMKRLIEKVNETKSWFFEKIKLVNL